MRSSGTLDLPSLWWVFMRTRYAATCCRRASICFSKFLPSISRLKICSQEFLTCNIHEAIAIFRLRKIAGQFARRKCVNRQIGTPACGKRQNLLSPRIERCVCEVKRNAWPAFFMVGSYENSLRGNLLPTSVNLL